MGGDKKEMNWFERVPKVELHVHLEGSIPLDVLWQLVQKYGGDPNVPDLLALQKKFEYRDFPHFLATWMWKNGFLRGLNRVFSSTIRGGTQLGKWLFLPR